MEALTRMVVDSLARHGLDRPVDPRRLQWSRWFRCDSTHSLLVVPSKPGIFALAEEVMNLGPTKTHGGMDAFVRPPEQSSAAVSSTTTADPSTPVGGAALGGAALQRCDSLPGMNAASAAEVSQRRMLAVLQFAEDDDMAFTLDRMFTRINPMRDRLASGLCFLRFVVIGDQAQRRSICAALNQWMLSSAEKASGLPSDFSSSLEFAHAPEATRVAQAPRAAEATRVGAGDSPAPLETSPNPALVSLPLRQTNIVSIAQSLDSGAAKNLHCSQPLPSGF
jgi:hypothetical protein